MLVRQFFTALSAAAFLAPPALSEPSLTRIATLPRGAEVTGLFVSGRDLFLNVQHPDDDNAPPFDRATVGVIAGADWRAEALPPPAVEAEKRTLRAASGAYRVLLRSGEAGVGEIRSASGAMLRASNRPDFNGFIPDGPDAGYLFTNWEDTPGGMSRTRLRRDAGGAWAVDRSDLRMLDFADVRGTWKNCFGTVSPWMTPLSSEELYFDDTANWNNPVQKRGGAPMADYLGRLGNPYDYGHIVEITDPAGAARPVKMLAMGRFSHENAVVMPDRRTAYMSDDGTDTVFFKFIADRPGDLTAGALYAAKITQEGPKGAEAATTPLAIDWIFLARGDNTLIEAWIRDYDGVTAEDFDPAANSYVTDSEVADWAAGRAADDRAAFLESRKAAAAKGATAEFRKMEGVNINLAGAADGSVPYLYMAMSAIDKGMADDKGDIALAKNKCGVVYEMKLDADFNVARMVPAVAGGPYDWTEIANPCAVGNIANPDNIVVLDDGAVLIGEDSGRHENNAVWLWRR